MDSSNNNTNYFSINCISTNIAIVKLKLVDPLGNTYYYKLSMRSFHHFDVVGENNKILDLDGNNCNGMQMGEFSRVTKSISL